MSYIELKRVTLYIRWYINSVLFFKYLTFINKFETKPSKVHIRHCILFQFNLGNKATDATKNICEAYGKDALDIRKCQRWFKKFRSGNTSLEDEPGRGRVSDFDKDTLRSVVKANLRMTQNDFAETLYSSQKTISRQMKAIDKMQKLGK